MQPFTGLPDSIPAIEELKAKPQWVAWTYETRKGRLTKPPVNPNGGGYASVSDPTNWTSYEQAAAFASKEGLAGVGFVLTEDDGYTGIDLDKCIAPDGTIADWAQFILDGYAETYAEVSPSGQGLRLIARGKPDKALKYDPAGVEVYGGGRYLTITGNRVPYTPDDIRAAPMTLAALAERVNSVRGESRLEAAAPETNPVASRTDFVGRTNQLALANLSAWVLELFPSAQHHASTGAYRVSSADLGRELEEDLSITPQGIVDFGLHDMGDPREGKRTAVEIVMEHCYLDEKTAAFWLCEKLDVAPEHAGYYTAADEFAEIPDAVDDALDTITASSFAPKETPKRRWLVPDLIPDRNVTILNGDGATGKSLLSMQLAIAAAAERRWIGQKVEPGAVLYFSAEDDEDETHIRLKEICGAEGIDVARLSRLHIAVMAGKDAILAAESSKSASILAKTRLFKRLRNTIARLKPRFVILDNLVDVFGANQNAPALARQFIGMLRGLAIEFECAVLLLAHPSLTGMASGTGSSGTVAWNNSVRSRLYLQREKDEDGVELDPNRRFLEAKKVNYGPTGTRVDMRWEGGRFVALDMPDMSDLDDMPAAEIETKEAKAERVFLSMIEMFNHAGRTVSPSLGANYAPTVFARHPRAAGVPRRYMEIAMETLLERGVLTIERVGPPSKQRQNIVFARETSNHLPTGSNQKLE